MAGLDPLLEPLGFAPVGEAIPLGDIAYQALVLDFGPRSVDGWLARLIDAESQAADAAPAAVSPS